MYYHCYVDDDGLVRGLCVNMWGRRNWGREGFGMMGLLIDRPVNDFARWPWWVFGGDGGTEWDGWWSLPSPAELAQEDVDVEAPLAIQQVHLGHLLLLLLPVAGGVDFAISGDLWSLGSHQAEQILHVSEVWRRKIIMSNALAPRFGAVYFW